MALSRHRRSGRTGPDYWPGFVDALSTMLLAFVFLISVFMAAQFYLSRDISGKDVALQQLNQQIAELTALLSLETVGKADAQAALTSLSATLEATQRDRAGLQARLAAQEAADANPLSGESSVTLEAQKQISAQAMAQVDLLNQQIAALRRQLAAVEQALQATESREKDAASRIADLGQRLNLALAQKVQELARYRSNFFGRLRDIIGSKPGVRVVGDRFVFQSEVLFDTGAAALNAQGRSELDTVAAALIDLEREIPPEISWVMRVDGHTDKRPIQSALYPSNWALSAARAIAVVQYFVTRGVAPAHLVAAGFGEFQPVEQGDSEDALRRNRRIELKLTER